MTDKLKEYAQASAALCDWFISQEISATQAVGIMSYLLGVMSAEIATSHSDLDRKIAVLHECTQLVGRATFLKKFGE